MDENQNFWVTDRLKEVRLSSTLDFTSGNLANNVHVDDQVQGVCSEPLP